MRTKAVELAIKKYYEIKKELAPVIDSLGYKALTILIFQKDKAGDSVFECQEIGYYPNAEALYGTYYDRRQTEDGPVDKQIRVFLDIETVRAIEFEMFEADPENPSQEEEEEVEEEPVVAEVVPRNPRACPICGREGVPDLEGMLRCGFEACARFNAAFAKARP